MNEITNIVNDANAQAENQIVCRYKYICENCGHETDWSDKPITENTEKIKMDLSADKAFMNYFTAGKACPKCRKSQSWYKNYDFETATIIFTVGMVAFVVLGGLYVSGIAVTIDEIVVPVLWPNLEPDGSTFVFLALFGLVGAIGALFVLGFQAIKMLRQKAQTAKLPKKNKPEVKWEKIN